MRTIRAMYNLGIKSGVAERENYPFKDYSITTVPTKKRALDWEFLVKIIDKDLSELPTLVHTRNYFVASYLMYGMNFMDMALLKKSDMVDGRIQYTRSKTGKHYDIRITANLNKILSFYINGNENSEYIFPIVKRDDPSLQYKDIEWARKRYNKKLKLLAAACDIGQNLTSYVSRHSFATQAMLQEVPVSAISAMLGHSSLKTTESYLKSLPSNILDAYNSRIMGNV
jgi:integrase